MATIDTKVDKIRLQTADPLGPAAGLAAAGEVTPVPPHRCHDPEKNLKQSDPFQFGSRFLGEDDDVFEFNAWDHVETDEAYKEHAERQFSMQHLNPVSDFDKGRFNSDPAKWWNLFYKNNTSNFFKNRKWLRQEFPVLVDAMKEDAGAKVILEVGAGAGNTAFPLLASNQNPLLTIHACDFSKAAIEVMRNHESFDANRMRADVWDVSGKSLPPGLDEASVDVVILIFIFSALSPIEWEQAISNIYTVLKPGGVVCFRDYGRGDLAQVRFRKGRYLEENFYIRGDGTRVYFFDIEELEQLWSGQRLGNMEGTRQSKFEIEKLGMDRRLLVNRAEKIKMYRCWLQGRFRKGQQRASIW